MTEQRKNDAVKYLKYVLGGMPDHVLLPPDIKEALGEVIIRAYLRGREDEAIILVNRACK